MSLVPANVSTIQVAIQSVPNFCQDVHVDLEIVLLMFVFPITPGKSMLGQRGNAAANFLGSSRRGDPAYSFRQPGANSFRKSVSHFSEIQIASRSLFSGCYKRAQTTITAAPSSSLKTLPITLTQIVERTTSDVWLGHTSSHNIIGL